MKFRKIHVSEVGEKGLLLHLHPFFSEVYRLTFIIKKSGMLCSTLEFVSKNSFKTNEFVVDHFSRSHYFIKKKR